MTDQTQTPATPAATTPAEVVVVALDPTPATPATPVVVPTLEAEQAGKVFTYEKTGDSGLDYALGFVGRLGFGPDHPAVAAATKGDFGILKAELAAIGDKAPGHAEVVAIAEAAFARTTEKRTEATKAISSYAVKAAESPERWATVQKWASVNADATEKAEINAALSAGGVQAKAAVDYLIKCYSKSQEGVKSPKAATKPDASPSPTQTSGPLTASEYSAEVQKLMRASGMRDIGGKPEYLALQSRRLAGKKLGK